jgi:hypothetical protein
MKAIHAVLTAALIAASISWSVAYPDCADHPSNTIVSSKENKYNAVYVAKIRQAWYDTYNNGAASMPRACTDPASNPRGVYSANLAPCRLQFHKISQDGDTSSSLHELSTACSDENLVEKSATRRTWSSLYEYVNNWPDECVASFTRCYSVAKDERIFINEACRHGLVFPEGTTHVSLDCSQDNAYKRDAIARENNNNSNMDTTTAEENNDPYDYLRQAAQQILSKNDEIREIHEMKMAFFFIVVVNWCLVWAALGRLLTIWSSSISPINNKTTALLPSSSRKERPDDGLLMMKTRNKISTTNTRTCTKNGGLTSEIVRVV